MIFKPYPEDGAPQAAPPHNEMKKFLLLPLFLLATVAQADDQGQHAGHHGDGGHDDGTGALVAGIHQGFETVQAMLAARHDGVLHQKNRVFLYDTHACDACATLFLFFHCV